MGGLALFALLVGILGMLASAFAALSAFLAQMVLYGSLALLIFGLIGMLLNRE